MIEILSFQNQTSDFTQSIDLEQVTITIRMIYNTRSESWYAHFSTTNYELNGIKLVKNFPLLWKHKSLFPELQGDFMIRKISDDINVNELNYDTLGIYFALFYLTETELEEWMSDNGI